MTVFSLTSPESLAVTFGVVSHLMKGNPRAQVDNLMIGPQGRLIKVKITAWLIRYVHCTHLCVILFFIVLMHLIIS